MTDADALPVFRYSPNAYELGLFVAEEGECEACGLERSLRYSGSFYSVDEVDYLCPWCVADGTAAAEFDGEFNDWLGIDGVPASPDATAAVDLGEARIVSTRTPSYPTWQQEEWRSHCGRPCAFIGDIGAADLPRFEAEPDFAADVNGGIGWDPEILRQHLRPGGDLAGYLFECLECGAHRLHADAS